MADPTEFGPRSSRRISGLEWTIIALGLGLALILLVGGLLPARERDRTIREENEHIADEVLHIEKDLVRRRERLVDRKYDPHVTERELREKGGLKDGEVPVPPDRTAPPGKQPPGKKAAESRAP